VTNLISKAIARVSSLLKELQIKQFLAVVLVGFLLLTTNAAPDRKQQAVSQKLDEVVHQNDSQRPKTTGEWNKEARETEGAPGERVQRIAGESAAALKDWSSVYPDTAERSARNLQND
jgi:hypothetical protein